MMICQIIYKHDGYDSNGLDLWLRHRGSKAENFHQKMHVAVESIMVESAHYLQVILAFYNVNAGVLDVVMSPTLVTHA